MKDHEKINLYRRRIEKFEEEIVAICKAIEILEAAEVFAGLEELAEEVNNLKSDISYYQTELYVAEHQ